MKDFFQSFFPCSYSGMDPSWTEAVGASVIMRKISAEGLPNHISHQSAEKNIVLQEKRNEPVLCPEPEEGRKPSPHNFAPSPHLYTTALLKLISVEHESCLPNGQRVLGLQEALRKDPPASACWVGGGFSPSPIPDAPAGAAAGTAVLEQALPKPRVRWHRRGGTAALPGPPAPSDLAERGAELLLSADIRPAAVSPSKRFAV